MRTRNGRTPPVERFARWNFQWARETVIDDELMAGGELGFAFSLGLGLALRRVQSIEKRNLTVV